MVNRGDPQAAVEPWRPDLRPWRCSAGAGSRHRRTTTWRRGVSEEVVMYLVAHARIQSQPVGKESRGARGGGGVSSRRLPLVDLDGGEPTVVSRGNGMGALAGEGTTSHWGRGWRRADEHLACVIAIQMAYVARSAPERFFPVVDEHEKATGRTDTGGSAGSPVEHRGSHGLLLRHPNRGRAGDRIVDEEGANTWLRRRGVERRRSSSPRLTTTPSATRGWIGRRRRLPGARTAGRRGGP